MRVTSLTLQNYQDLLADGEKEFGTFPGVPTAAHTMVDGETLDRGFEMVFPVGVAQRRTKRGSTILGNESATALLKYPILNLRPEHPRLAESRSVPGQAFG